jgi:hypothetical protein
MLIATVSAEASDHHRTLTAVMVFARSRRLVRFVFARARLMVANGRRARWNHFRQQVHHAESLFERLALPTGTTRPTNPGPPLVIIRLRLTLPLPPHELFNP